MIRSETSGSTEVLDRQDRSQSVIDGGSTENLRDLRALHAWLRDQPTSNTTKVVEAYLDLALKHFERNPEAAFEEYRQPWSRIQGIFKTPSDPIGPTGLSQFVKTAVIERWFEARNQDYQQHCRRDGAKPLRFVEFPGKPLTYGFDHIESLRSEDKPFLIEGAVMRWQRDPVPLDQISPLWRLIYPEGRFHVSGWRWGMIITVTCIQGLAFCAGILGAVLCSIAMPKHWEQMVYPMLISCFFTWAIYHFMMVPALREADLRTSPARVGTTRRGGSAWIDRVNPNLGLEKDDPRYRPDAIPYRELVRWRAECPICGSPIELKNDSPVMKGLVGCCVESPDEHSFTFDRVTLEGRPLRARPAA